MENDSNKRASAIPMCGVGWGGVWCGVSNPPRDIQRSYVAKAK